MAKMQFNPKTLLFYILNLFIILFITNINLTKSIDNLNTNLSSIFESTDHNEKNNKFLNIILQTMKNKITTLKTKDIDRYELNKTRINKINNWLKNSIIGDYNKEDMLLAIKELKQVLDNNSWRAKEDLAELNYFEEVVEITDFDNLSVEDRDKNLYKICLDECSGCCINNECVTPFRCKILFFTSGLLYIIGFCIIILGGMMAILFLGAYMIDRFRRSKTYHKEYKGTFEAIPIDDDFKQK